MENKKLSDICLIQSGGTPSRSKQEYWNNGNIPWVKISDFDGKYLSKTTEYITEQGLQRSSAKLFKKGTILYTIFATLGEVCILDIDATTNQAIAGLTLVDENIIKDYLYYYLISLKQTVNEIGRGVAQNNINMSILKNMTIPILSKEEQINIVLELESISSLITARREQLAKLDELVKARFVELFGDPVANPKGWDTPLIENVVANEKNALKAGPFGSALKKEYYVSSGYKIYGQEQVISGDHTFGDYYIDEERYKMLENCAVQAGDVLISLVGTYGKLLVMPEEFEPGIINPRLMKITFDKSRVNPYYFQHYFQSDSLKKALAENTHGGTMDILNLGIVRKLAMPLPPLELQNEFLRFVEQTDKSKLAVQQSLEKLETLKKALMQKYFG